VTTVHASIHRYLLSRHLQIGGQRLTWFLPSRVGLSNVRNVHPIHWIAAGITHDGGVSRAIVLVSEREQR
jgi:hypothetical protein